MERPSIIRKISALTFGFKASGTEAEDTTGLAPAEGMDAGGKDELALDTIPPVSV
jgi:hypothetical protein